jgi:hypothetical protein
VGYIFPEYYADKPRIKAVVFFSHFTDTIDIWWFQDGRPAATGNMLDEIRARLCGESDVVGRRFSVGTSKVGADCGLEIEIEVIWA